MSLADLVKSKLQARIDAPGSLYTSGISGGVLLGGATKMPSERAMASMSRMMSRRGGSYGGKTYVQSTPENRARFRRAFLAQQSAMAGGSYGGSYGGASLEERIEMGKAARKARKARPKKGPLSREARMALGKLARDTFRMDALAHCKEGDLESWLMLPAKEKRRLRIRARHPGLAAFNRREREETLADALLHGQGAYSGGRRAYGAAMNPWVMWVKEVRAANPGMSYKRALEVASRSYHRMGGVLLGGRRRMRRGGVLLGGSLEEEEAKEPEAAMLERYGYIVEQCLDDSGLVAPADADEHAEMQAYISDLIGPDGESATAPRIAADA